jgi:Protein of unknown function (DUF3489)
MTARTRGQASTPLPKQSGSKRKPDVARRPSTDAHNPSKLDLMVSLLMRPEGASLAELATATGWQTHSVRGALAGSLKKKGHRIVSQKSDPDKADPDKAGPEKSGPEKSDPDKAGPETSGPDKSGGLRRYRIEAVQQ